MSDDSERLLTVEVVAEVLRAHPETIRRMIREGRLPAVKHRGRWLILRGDFDAWISTQPRR